MKYTFYITQDGSVERENDTLVFIGKDFKKHLPVLNVEDIIISGKVSLSSWALDYLSKIGIIVHILRSNGTYMSSIVPISKNEIGANTVKQAMAYSSEERLDIAAEMVEGIRHNIIRNLRYYNEDGAISGIIERIRSYAIKKDNINSILGVEGNIWSDYYSSFPKIFKGYPSFKRQFHPPPDSLNAMISFGNAMLYSSVLTKIIASGLNPSISFLHEPSDRSFSLALDIADVFKPVIVERLVAYLVNNRIMKEGDFEERDGGVYLNDTGRTKFVSAYRDRMESSLKVGKGYATYETIIGEECYKLLRHVSEGKRYRSFRMWD